MQVSFEALDGRSVALVRPPAYYQDPSTSQSGGSSDHSGVALVAGLQVDVRCVGAMFCFLTCVLIGSLFVVGNDDVLSRCLSSQSTKFCFSIFESTSQPSSYLFPFLTLPVLYLRFIRLISYGKRWYPAMITKPRGRSCYDVQYDTGEIEAGVSVTLLESLPHQCFSDILFSLIQASLFFPLNPTSIYQILSNAICPRPDRLSTHPFTHPFSRL